jgi:hypothetical protein
MSDSPVEIVEALMAVVEAAPGQLGFGAVYYGDQAVIPVTPALCVGMAGMDSELAVSRLDHELFVYLLIYHGKIQDVQQNQKEADQLAEELRLLLHEDPQLGGRVIHGFVQRLESGYARRENSLMSMHRLTWFARTRTVNPFGG